MRHIKTDRNIVIVVLLSIITCGIYGYWFIYTIAQDVNEMCQDDGQTTSGLGIFILLSFVTCGFYAYYWYYQLGNRLNMNASRYGLTFAENGTTVLVWCIIGMLICGLGQYVAMHIIIKNTNAMAMVYNQMHNV